jgi:hypothetical protein
MCKDVMMAFPQDVGTEDSMHSRSVFPGCADEDNANARAGRNRREVLCRRGAVWRIVPVTFTGWLPKAIPGTAVGVPRFSSGT